MKLRLPVFVFSVLLAALLTAAIASAADLGKVRVGYIPVGDCLQLYVAEELGYFAELGLSVEKQAVKGGALIAMAVESGDLDLGWSNLVSLAVARDKGFPFVVLAPGAYEDEQGHRVHSLLVRPDSPIASLADLKGRTVAINTLGNINDLALAALAKEQGLAPGDIKLVEVPFPQMEAALAGGSVDCALILEPFVTKGLAAGSVKVLDPAPLRVYGERFLLAAWFAKSDWIAKHPEQAQAFRAAVLRASDFIAAHPEQAREILVKHTGLEADLAQRIAMPAFVKDVTGADVQAMLDLVLAFEYVKKPLQPQELFSEPLQ